LDENPSDESPSDKAQIPQKTQTDPKADKGEIKEAAPAEPKAPEGLVAQNRILESSKPAKIFVLGCSQMLHDNMLDTQGRTTNATFILNVIDHLNGEDNIARMRSKQQTLNPVAETDPLAKTIIKTFNIAGLPVLVVLFGFLVLFRRNLKKKKIADMYS